MLINYLLEVSDMQTAVCTLIFYKLELCEMGVVNTRGDDISDVSLMS